MIVQPAQPFSLSPLAPTADSGHGLGLRMTFAAGEEIYAQGEDTDLIYQILSGSVRTSRLMSDGRRQIGDFYFAQDLIGLETGAEHRFSAEALEDCDVLVIKRGALRRHGEEGLQFERLMWAATCRELERAQEHMLLLGRKTALEKVAGFLMEIADRFKAEFNLLPMGRQDMADYLGLTIETVSRMLSQLQADGLVEFRGCRVFRLNNRSGLRRLAAS